MTGADGRSAALASRQHGVIHHNQALELGFQRKAIYRRLNSGLWRAVHPRVYLLGGAPLTWKGALMGACLWAQPNSAVSHAAAARLHGLEHFSKTPVEISTTRKLTGTHGIVAHRCSQIPADLLVAIDGLPVTDVERTLLDVAGTAKRYAVEAALDGALRRGQTDLMKLKALLESEAKQGREGRRVMTELLVERGAGLRPRDSDLHRSFVRLLRRSGIRGFSEYVPVRDELGFFAEIDVAFPERKLGFEVDGYSAHGNKPAFDHDRERERKLILLGWTVVNVTKKHMDNPGPLLEDIRALLRKQEVQKWA